MFAPRTTKKEIFEETNYAIYLGEKKNKNNEELNSNANKNKKERFEETNAIYRG